MWREIRLAVRGYARDRGYAGTVLLTLLACVAAATLTFAVVNSVLLRPLPVPEADAILLLANRYPKAGVGDMNQSAGGDYTDRKAGVPALMDQTLFRSRAYTIDGDGGAERVDGMTVTHEFFPLVRTPPAVGRTFTAADDEPGNDRKVILSDELWRQLFGGREDVAGQTLRMDGVAYQVVGVMPEHFQFVNPKARLWTPLALPAEERQAHHSNNYWHAGRLRPGATMAQAQAQVDALNRANLERMPELRELLVSAGFHTKVEPLRHVLVKNVEGVLYLLWIAALLVLAIGGLNVANLALAKLSARRREVATRLALGATRAQLMRQSVVESVLLTVGGGLLGIGAAYLLLPVMAALGVDRLPRANEVRIDGFVVSVSLALSAAVGAAMGLLPLTNLFPESLSDALREDNRTGTSGGGTKRVRQALVVLEVGSAFVLLVGAGLLLASFRNLLRVDPGFAREGVTTVSLAAPQSRYGGAAALRSLNRRILDNLRQLPGVRLVGATSSIPLGGDYSDNVIFAEGYVRRPGESIISPKRVRVTPGYLEAMAIGLVRGRMFTERDDENAERAILIDEALAKRFWGDVDPIGRRMFLPEGANDVTPTERTKWMRVVGVVKEVRQTSLEQRESVGVFYLPFEQSPQPRMTFAVRSGGETVELTRAIRRAIAEVDPGLALFDVQTMGARTELSLASRRTSLTLALAFGALALFLSATGIYGVLAYLVSQRRREIGIRVALGSSRARIVELVVRQGLGLVGIGLAAGVGGALAMQRAVASQVYGVQPLEPVVLVSAVGILAVTGLAACLLPARRALAVDPVKVLNE